MLDNRINGLNHYDKLVFAISIISFILLSFVLSYAPPVSAIFSGLDSSVNSLMNKVGPMLFNVGFFISTIGGTEISGMIGVSLAIILFLKKRWQSALIMFFSVVLTAGAVLYLKDLIGRVRPDHLVNILEDPSFPSGHAAMSSALFFALAYVFALHVPIRSKRRILVALCTLAFFAVGVSRLILNVHWASDVLAGWLLGIFISSLTILLVRYASHKKQIIN